MVFGVSCGANAPCCLTWYGSPCNTAGKMGRGFMSKRALLKLFLEHYNRSLNMSTLDFSVRHTVEQNCLVAVEARDLVILRVSL